jgi:uncharacterized protein YndB with AHSA1/START domain
MRRFDEDSDIRIELTFEIERPVEEVFAYVTDPEKLPEWQPTTLAVTKETDGPMGKGTRLREVRRGPLGKRVESLVEVSEYEPNRRFGLRILSGPLPIDGHHEFEPTEAGTRLVFVAEGQPGGPMRILSPLLARVLRRQFASYYVRLKTILEAR